jgi:CDP-glucose 4,6-dehydratase
MGWLKNALEGAALRGAVDADFWCGRRVLLTGHTGFKGGWAALWLHRMGAKVTGLGLAPDTDPSLFQLAGVARDTDSRLVDLKDRHATAKTVRDCAPEIVIHMAAQALVRRAARDPFETFATNVMGTVHLLDALREAPHVKAILVVTSDKVYRNDETGRPFREDDPLGGHEPYSASKAAAEMIARAYAQGHFQPKGVALGTARGGNVLGGGDFAEDRLVPDIVRASMAGVNVALRHPESTRPWQHVLDCLAGYLCYGQKLASGDAVPSALNFGPASQDSMTVAKTATEMLAVLPGKMSWVHIPRRGPRESKLLALDSSLARRELGWSDRYRGPAIVKATAQWYKAFRDGADMRKVTLAQIDAYMAMAYSGG